MEGNVSFLVAFGAGFLSFVSPCVITLVPVYLASLYGPGVFEEKGTGFRLPLFLHSLAFVTGFSAVFIFLGALAGMVGFALGPYAFIMRQIAGSILIFFGVYMLAATKVPWVNYERRLSTSTGATTGYLRSFLTGSIFSLAWTPCVGPVLGGVLTLALDSATASRGAYLLAIYSLGLGLPFLLMGIAFDALSPLLKRIRQYSSWIYIVSGVLLIATGILVLTNRLVWF
jgi:cytochrome c-type biogenesis protein